MSVPANRDRTGPPVLGGGPGDGSSDGSVVAPLGVSDDAVEPGGPSITSIPRAAAQQRLKPGPKPGATKSHKRGAGAGARPKAAAADADPSVRLRVDAAPKSRVQPVTDAPADPAQLLASAASAEQIASHLVAMLTGTAGLLVGGDASLNPLERDMIVPPAGRMLARMTPADVAKYSALMDPLSLLGGVAIWGARVWSIRMVATAQAQRAAEQRAAAAQAQRTARGPDSAVPVRTPPIPGAVTLNGHIPVTQNGAAPAPDDIRSMLDGES